MISQIVVSVVAAICVALITNAYLDREAAKAAANAPLPPLASETVADLPVKDVGTPEAEIFPGVPANGALASAIPQARAANEERERRRSMGLPAPYTPPVQELAGTAETPAAAGAEAALQ